MSHHHIHQSCDVPQTTNLSNNLENQTLTSTEETSVKSTSGAENIVIPNNNDRMEIILTNIIQLTCNISHIDNIIPILSKILQHLISIQNGTAAQNFL